MLFRSLEPLPGVTMRDDALKANGFAPMGDLSGALQAPGGSGARPMTD